MLAESLTPLESLGVLVLGLSLIWILAAIGNRRVAAQKQSDNEQLPYPLDSYAYFCQNHHYLGLKKPPEGRFCQQCVADGFITATCRQGGEPHLAHPLSVDWMDCEEHGKRKVTKRSITLKKSSKLGAENPLTRKELLEHNRAEKLPIPTPVRDPLPEKLVVEIRKFTNEKATIDPAVVARSLSIPELRSRLLQLTDEVRSRLSDLEQDLLSRSLDLETAIPSRRPRIWFWYSMVALILAMLLGFAPVLMVLFTDIGNTLQSVVASIMWAINSVFSLALYMFVVWVTVFLTFFVISSIVRKKWGIKWFHARATFFLAELLALVVLPYLLGRPITLPEVVIGLGFDVAAEVIVLALRWTWALRHLVGQTRAIGPKLTEVREILKDWNLTRQILLGPMN